MYTGTDTATATAATTATTAAATAATAATGYWLLLLPRLLLPLVLLLLLLLLLLPRLLLYYHCYDDYRRAAATAAATGTTKTTTITTTMTSTSTSTSTTTSCNYHHRHETHSVSFLPCLCTYLVPGTGFPFPELALAKQTLTTNRMNLSSKKLTPWPPGSHHDLSQHVSATQLNRCTDGSWRGCTAHETSRARAGPVDGHGSRCCPTSRETGRNRPVVNFSGCLVSLGSTCGIGKAGRTAGT